MWDGVYTIVGHAGGTRRRIQSLESLNRFALKGLTHLQDNWLYRELLDFSKLFYSVSSDIIFLWILIHR